MMWNSPALLVEIPFSRPAATRVGTVGEFLASEQRVVDPGVCVRCIKRLEIVPEHACAHPNSQRKCDYYTWLKKPCETIPRRHRVVLLYKQKSFSVQWQWYCSFFVTYLVALGVQPYSMTLDMGSHTTWNITFTWVNSPYLSKAQVGETTFQRYALGLRRVESIPARNIFLFLGISHLVWWSMGVWRYLMEAFMVEAKYPEQPVLWTWTRVLANLQILWWANTSHHIHKSPYRQDLCLLIRYLQGCCELGLLAR